MCQFLSHISSELFCVPSGNFWKARKPASGQGSPIPAPRGVRVLCRATATRAACTPAPAGARRRSPKMRSSPSSSSLEPKCPSARFTRRQWSPPRRWRNSKTPVMSPIRKTSKLIESQLIDEPWLISLSQPKTKPRTEHQRRTLGHLRWYLLPSEFQWMTVGTSILSVQGATSGCLLWASSLHLPRPLLFFPSAPPPPRVLNATVTITQCYNTPALSVSHIYVHHQTTKPLK